MLSRKSNASNIAALFAGSVPRGLTRAVGDAHVAEALNGLPFAMLFLDGQGRVAYANDRAEALLKKGLGLRLVDQVLTAEDASDAEALGEKVARMTAAVRNARPGEPPLSASPEELQKQPCNMLSVKRPEPWYPLTVILTPLQGQRDAADPDDGPGNPLDDHPVVAVFVNDPDGGQDLSPEALTALFGLTHSEAALTLALLEGKGLQWAAGRCNMSLNTARTHLKRVFEKTRTHRQAELVRLVLRSALPLRS